MVTETARVLLTAGILSAVALTTFVWRVIRPGRAPHDTDRSIEALASGSPPAGQHRCGGHRCGGGRRRISKTHRSRPPRLTAMLASLIVLRSEPPAALLIAALFFLLHSVFDWAHRPGLLSVQFVPHWWTLGCGIYGAYLAVLCLLARFLGKLDGRNKKVRRSA